VALLLDWENIKGCLRQEGDASPKLKALLATARQYGPLAVARAYADWGEQSRVGVAVAILVRRRIEPVYTIGGGLKNSADIRLAVDAIALCERSPEITTYLIGSGDGGLISVVNYLRLRGRQVIVIAVGASLSGYLRDAADLTLCYKEAIEPTSAIGKPPPFAPNAAPSTPMVKPTKAKKATPMIKPNATPTDDAAALGRAFAALPRAVVTARLKSKNGVALNPAVQRALQTEFGCKLSTLGRKPGTFSAEAARRGLVQTAVLTKGTSKSDILFLPGEPTPTLA